ncbi:RES family NAD+ phosphorylase [Caballeronia glebae]|uniref:RES family NAD+ phosphorylase n=1 Tax=Caballeronia glebae TaxID=1777143 RepID=UPI0038B87B54
MPTGLGTSTLTVWRLEREKHFPTWNTAEGAFLVGGRWSSPGQRVIYASLDPATTILEVAVHKGFNVLDSVPHRLLEIELDVTPIKVLHPSDVPNPHWLSPGAVSPNQQKFGDALLATSPLTLVPSTVSKHSWNLLINISSASGLVALKNHERFALDPRLTKIR